MKVCSSRLRRRPSIQPWHSASSRASPYVRLVGVVTFFFASTSQTPSDD
jgi:hypothetical protein